MTGNDLWISLPKGRYEGIHEYMNDLPQEKAVSLRQQSDKKKMPPFSMCGFPSPQKQQTDLLPTGWNHIFWDANGNRKVKSCDAEQLRSAQFTTTTSTTTSTSTSTTSTSTTSTVTVGNPRVASCGGHWSWQLGIDRDRTSI